MSLRILVDRNVSIPMRDGTQLKADIYRPELPGQIPAILCRLPYNKDDLLLHLEAIHPVRAAEAGYAVIYQDTRGRYQSEGDFYPFIGEGQDGYNTVEWIAAQPWCSGAVGMTGASYFGATQWWAAIQQPPHLKAIIPIITSSEYYEGWTYQGGAFQLGFALLWTLMALAPETAVRLAKKGAAETDEAARITAACDNIELLFRHLPLSEIPVLKTSRMAEYYDDWLAHERRDEYWDSTAINRKYNHIQVPAFNIGAWYDLFLHGTLENYNGMRREGATQAIRDAQRLLVAPWAHGNFSGDFPGYRFGAQASAAGIDLCGLELQFFDYHLKGMKDRLDESHPVRIFVMGENRWRDERDWPLPGTQYTPCYLHSQGCASSYGGSLSMELPAEEPADAYLYDPRNPAPTVGGSTFLPGLRFGTKAGPQDQQEVESRADVLVYTSGPLDQALEVTGPLEVKLWASSSAIDTDFVARLCDVYPDGASQILAEGILRARYRNGLDHPEWLSPGEAYLFTIDLVATSNVFLPGHRIRVDITSSSFPRFNIHPNTGKALADYTEADMAPALQQVFHDADHPSHIILPIIPRESLQ